MWVISLGLMKKKVLVVLLNLLGLHCWRPQEWILKVGLQSRKTINKSAQSMRSQE
jgi:hypothetical protein